MFSIMPALCLSVGLSAYLCICRAVHFRFECELGDGVFAFCLRSCSQCVHPFQTSDKRARPSIHVPARYPWQSIEFFCFTSVLNVFNHILVGARRNWLRSHWRPGVWTEVCLLSLECVHVTASPPAPRYAPTDPRSQGSPLCSRSGTTTERTAALNTTRSTQLWSRGS